MSLYVICCLWGLNQSHWTLQNLILNHPFIFQLISAEGSLDDGDDIEIVKGNVKTEKGSAKVEGNWCTQLGDY